MHRTLRIQRFLLERAVENAVRKVAEKTKYRVLQIKDELDLVTEADLKAEKAILKTLKKANVACVVESEESDHPLYLSEKVECKIYIDPIDGSYQLSKGNNRLVASGILACDMKDRPIASAVADLSTGNIYSADSEGAYLNHRRIRCPSRDGLEGALIGVYAEGGELFRKLQALLSLPEKGVRILNYCGQVTKCEVATGIYDAALELRPVDIYELAGYFIAQQAGALVTTLEGSPLKYSNVTQTGIATSNPALRKKIIEILS